MGSERTDGWVAEYIGAYQPMIPTCAGSKGLGLESGLLAKLETTRSTCLRSKIFIDMLHEQRHIRRVQAQIHDWLGLV